MNLAIINNFKQLESAKDRIKFITGFGRIVQQRQQHYLALMTPILLAGLYGKEKVIYFITTYWYLIPLWLFWVMFDILVLLPGEQLFYSSSNKLFMDIHKDRKNKRNGKTHE